MKKLTCEMCGSTDLLKQEGVFVCQACGCKYSVEEAKKMMVEGTVDVSGSTVKVDTSDKLANYYELARRSKDELNIEMAAKYYDLVLQECPNDWEAVFYSNYFTAMQMKIGEIENLVFKVKQCLGTVINLIKNNVPEDKQNKAVFDVVSHTVALAKHLNSSAIKIRNESTTDDKLNVYNSRAISIGKMASAAGDIVDEVFPDNSEMHNYALMAWEEALKIYPKLQYAGLYSTRISKYGLVGKRIEEKNNINAELADIKIKESKLNRELGEAILNLDRAKINASGKKSNPTPWIILWSVIGISCILSFANRTYFLGILFIVSAIIITISIKVSVKNSNEKIKGKTKEELEEIVNALQKKKSDLYKREKELQAKLKEM